MRISPPDQQMIMNTIIEIIKFKMGGLVFEKKEALLVQLILYLKRYLQSLSKSVSNTDPVTASRDIVTDPVTASRDIVTDPVTASRDIVTDPVIASRDIVTDPVIASSKSTVTLSQSVKSNKQDTKENLKGRKRMQGVTKKILSLNKHSFCASSAKQREISLHSNEQSLKSSDRYKVEYFNFYRNIKLPSNEEIESIKENIKKSLDINCMKNMFSDTQIFEENDLIAAEKKTYQTLGLQFASFAKKSDQATGHLKILQRIQWYNLYMYQKSFLRRQLGPWTEEAKRLGLTISQEDNYITYGKLLHFGVVAPFGKKALWLNLSMSLLRRIGLKKIKDWAEFSNIIDSSCFTNINCMDCGKDLEKDVRSQICEECRQKSYCLINPCSKTVARPFLFCDEHQKCKANGCFETDDLELIRNSAYCKKHISRLCKIPDCTFQQIRTNSFCAFHGV